MYSISYIISYMQCSAFFFHSTRETLLNREHESEWLIHKWDPDSVIGNADATASSSAKVANILPSAFRTNRYPSVLGFMIDSCKNARRRGWRHSRLEAFEHQAENLTHGGDHTGRVVRSKGEAGRRVHRRRSGQHVAGVAEGRNVAERGHVSGEGGWVEGAALGEVLQRVMYLFALFGFARHFSVSGLDAFLLHSQGSVNIVQLVVEPAGVADRVPVGIPSPERGSGGLTVCTGRSCPSCCRQPSLGLNQGSVLSIHLVVEPTGIAQVVPSAISSPQWGRGRPAVHTLPAFCAGSRLGPRLAPKAGGRAPKQGARREESGAVFWDVGRVGGDGVVRRGCCPSQGGHAAPRV